jgi:hypothetical protein
MTMIAYAFLQQSRLAAARREKNNWRATPSAQLACRAKRHRHPDHATATALPALPKINRPAEA